MHVTLDIDDDVLRTAIVIAERENRPVDSIISDLARRGMVAERIETSQDTSGLSGLRVNGRRVSTERIKRIQEEFDRDDALKAVGR